MEIALCYWHFLGTVGCYSRTASVDHGWLPGSIFMREKMQESQTFPEIYDSDKFQLKKVKNSAHSAEREI